MTSASVEDPLVGLLSAIGSTPRLALLRHLQVPKALREIEVAGDRPDSGEVLTRQSVRSHLDRLIAAGLVLDLPAKRAYGETREYVVHHAQIYALGEDVKSLSRYRAAYAPTVPTAGATPQERATGDGPRLVVVKGLDEGTTFRLEGRPMWLIGRKRDADIPLDFDPFVSSENATIERVTGGFVVRDCPGSRNGTWVNFEPLAAGASHALRHGDVIGVGRSALVYWT